MVLNVPQESKSQVRNHVALDIQRSAPIIRAYLACSNELQAHARQLFETLNDPETDSEDRLLCALTLTELLFPNVDDMGPLTGLLGVDLQEVDDSSQTSNEPEVRNEIRRMDQEEADFAKRLSDLMYRQNINQSQLAEIIGVGQPAISMMLNRKCRPQKRTIEKIAKALGVSNEELWPSL